MIDNNLGKKNYINNLLNTYFNLFVVILVSFLLLLSYFLLLKPKVDETTNAISENISSHERLLQAEKNKLASLKEAILAYEKIDPVDLARVNGILPNEYNKEVLYGEIEEVIKQNGFIPTSIILSKEGEDESDVKDTISKTASKLGVVNISLGIASVDYAGMKNLLNVLETNLRMLDVKQLGISDGSAGNLKIDTYYYKK